MRITSDISDFCLRIIGEKDKQDIHIILQQFLSKDDRNGTLDRGKEELYVWIRKRKSCA